jgi:hypothetical protein
MLAGDADVVANVASALVEKMRRAADVVTVATVPCR